MLRGRDGVAKDLNFRVCPYPNAKGVYVATIGSNHGFKFLPVIGRLVADAIEGKLPDELVKKFAVDRVWGPPDLSREGYAQGPLEIDLEELAKNADDLTPIS